jgi:mono/diheme cytochrome c family protein
MVQSGIDWLRKGGNMPKRFLPLLTAAILSTAMCGVAQQTTQVKLVPVTPTPASSGQEMYATYCSVCHGADGRGNGPATSALNQRPTDLTTLARNHQGKFPDLHVVSVLRFGVETPAHGSKDMPIWGPALRSLNPASQLDEGSEQLRVSNLTSYLRSMQQ